MHSDIKFYWIKDNNEYIPVANEPIEMACVVHGKWEWVSDISHISHRCSVCKDPAKRVVVHSSVNLSYTYTELLSNYCPNCGARMEGKDG